MADNLESTPVSSDSFSVKPAPYSRKGKIQSATNSSNVGVATSKKGHTESK